MTYFKLLFRLYFNIIIITWEKVWKVKTFLDILKSRLEWNLRSKKEDMSREKWTNGKSTDLIKARIHMRVWPEPNGPERLNPSRGLSVLQSEHRSHTVAQGTRGAWAGSARMLIWIRALKEGKSGKKRSSDHPNYKRKF